MNRLRCRSCGRFSRVSKRRVEGEPLWEEETKDLGGIKMITPKYNGTTHHCDNCSITWQEEGFFGEGPIGISLNITRVEKEPVTVETLNDMLRDRFGEEP